MGRVFIEAATAGGFTAGFHLVPVAFRSLRERVVALVDTFDADDWGRQSGCELWTVHDVVRHVRDACAIHVQSLRREGNALLDEPFDNRRTPLRWLERTARELPAKTVDDLGGWLRTGRRPCATESRRAATRRSWPPTDRSTGAS